MSDHDDLESEDWEDEVEEGEDEEVEEDDENEDDEQPRLAVGDAVGDATVVQVAEECDRGAALLSDGRVLSWDDACDDEDDEPPTDLGPAVQVDVSIDHTVALLADGRVVCWGSNDWGQCDVPSDLGPAVRVFAGEDLDSDSEYTRRYTAALQADGRTRLWGHGLCNGLPWEVAGEHAMELLISSKEQLTTCFGFDLLSKSPLDVRDIAGDTYSGEGHGVAALSDGRVLCWGENADGQCNVPADLGPAVQVAAGRHHTAVLLSDGRVLCWGSNYTGQCNVPTDMGPVAQLAVAKGDPSQAADYWASGRTFDFGSSDDVGNYTAALLADGRTRLWGEGPCDGLPWGVADEQVMDLLVSSDTMLTKEFGEKLLKRLPSGVVRRKLFGKEHGVALLADGRVVCWGKNQKGACDVPASIQGRVSAVHAKGASTWAVDVDGRLHGWGEIKKVDSLPVKLSDESWLEFATRMWGQTQETIYPEHIRESEAFKAIRTMHTLAEQ